MALQPHCMFWGRICIGTKRLTDFYTVHKLRKYFLLYLSTHCDVSLYCNNNMASFSRKVYSLLAVGILLPQGFGFAFNRPNLPSTTLNQGLFMADEGSASSGLAPVPTEWRGEVLQALKVIVDPDLNQDIVTLGFIKQLTLDEESREISFDVELTTPACPVKDQFQADCESVVLGLPFVNSAKVSMTAQPSAMETSTLGMAQVGAVIAVSSCKGGVGKSTTAVNLAYALQSLGASVGIFDADVYGPSLPTMIKPDDDIVRFVGRQIAPLQRNGVRLMSFGYVNEGSAIMRGPMVTQLLDQFLSVTHWGSLDYLILDMPPGTGDIQLTLTQRLNITAAVIVTTPQELSFADVVRGVEMFDSVNVPSVAVVENMAYYEVESEQALDRAKLQEALAEILKEKGAVSNGNSIEDLAQELVDAVIQTTPNQQIPIFGPGHKQRLSEQWGIDHTFSMPLMDRIAKNGDSGTPYVLEHPESAQTAIYLDLARAVVSEVSKTKYSNRRPEISYDSEKHQITVQETTAATSTEVSDEKSTSNISPADLRRACRCAACVEEMTGRQILKPSDIPESVKPLKMASTGNYALSVDWSDGHRSLYPYRQIRALIQPIEDDKRAATEPPKEAPSNLQNA